MRVLAALSGGVDSAVAAARAVEAGHDVTAVHMALSRTPAQLRTGSRGCCSLEDASDARRAADTLGIDFYVWDLSQQFEDLVVADFLSEYQAGRTPNPCVRCNEHIKFATLARRAHALGFDAVCTGHYAQIVADSSGAQQLCRATYRPKDQSYVLAVMGPQALPGCLFPLGDAPSKDAVRQEAAARGLGVSAKPDSYDICFVADGDTSGFLRRALGERPGPIVDDNGTQIGEHSGAYQFTVGQRRGLRLGRPAPDGKPRYVIATDPQRNTVVVGPEELLTRTSIRATAPVWYRDVLPGQQLSCAAQVRAHGQEHPGTVTVSDAGLQVALDVPVRGLAAGQSVVLYDGDAVMAQATVS